MDSSEDELAADMTFEEHNDYAFNSSILRKQSDRDVASSAHGVGVAQRPKQTTSHLIEQFMRPVKDRGRAKSTIHDFAVSPMDKPVQKSRMRNLFDQEIFSNDFPSEIRTPLKRTMEISIPRSPSFSLPERTKALTERISKKRENLAKDKQPVRPSKIPKIGQSIDDAREKSNVSKSSARKEHTKMSSAASTPLLKSLAGKTVDQLYTTSKSDGAISTPSETLPQSPAPSFCIEVKTHSPLPSLTNQLDKPQRPVKQATKPGKPGKTRRPPKLRPSRELQKPKQESIHSRLPYHEATNDFMVLVSPRKPPKHNGSSDFFVVDDDEKHIQMAQYPKSRDIDRKQAALERAKWSLAFHPPCILSNEVT